MRHLVRGRKLGRNSSHRKAMFRNMAASLIKTVNAQEDVHGDAKVRGRIVTTVAKAKELRPYVEKLITLAKKALPHEQRASQFATDAVRGSDAWKSWRESEQWQKWAQAMAPAVEYRRRAFALLRDKEALDILFNDLAERFADRNGGYTRVIQIAQYRLGDAGKQALIEFVGERDRVKRSRTAPVVINDEDTAPAATSETPVNQTASDAPASEATAEANASEDTSAQDASQEKPAEE